MKLGYGKDCIRCLENRELKLVDIDLINAVIEELNIRDKIRINDEYINFLLGDPQKAISGFRKRENLTKQELADMLGVWKSSIRAWETGKTLISRAKFEQLKRCMS